MKWMKRTALFLNNYLDKDYVYEKKLKATVLADKYQICHLAINEKIPSDVYSQAFYSITKTSDEISIIIPESDIIKDAQIEKGWRCIKVLGPLDFKLTGILASITTPLAQAGISVLSISTFETDYLFIKEKELKLGLAILSKIMKLVGSAT